MFALYTPLTHTRTCAPTPDAGASSGGSAGASGVGADAGGDSSGIDDPEDADGDLGASDQAGGGFEAAGGGVDADAAPPSSVGEIAALVAEEQDKRAALEMLVEMLSSGLTLGAWFGGVAREWVLGGVFFFLKGILRPLATHTRVFLCFCLAIPPPVSSQRRDQGAAGGQRCPCGTPRARGADGWRRRRWRRVTGGGADTNGARLVCLFELVVAGKKGAGGKEGDPRRWLPLSRRTGTWHAIDGPIARR